MNAITAKLTLASSINDVYALLSEYLQSTLKESVCILLQLDDKQNEAYVYDLIGLHRPLFNKLIRILGLNPVGKRFKNSPYGAKYFYSSHILQSFNGNLYQLADGLVPEWICQLIESVFNIQNIHFIGLKHDEVVIGCVLVFPRKEDKSLFKKVNRDIPLFSIRMKEIMESYKKEMLGIDTRERFTRAIINNISHEIRTPLNGIVGLIDAGLQLLDSNENTRELTSIIWKNSLELTNKLDNLLLISDLESGAASFSIQEQPIQIVFMELEQVVRKLNFEFRNRHIVLNSYIQDDDYSQIPIDVYYLRMVVNELVNNALKFSEGGVSVSLSRDTHLRLTVCDQGIGMTTEEIAQYVKAFSRTKEVKEQYRGMGIGLSIVKLIVNKLGWNIKFVSQPNRGTSVTLELGLLCQYLER
jgi:signal transduction histidine kinase